MLLLTLLDGIADGSKLGNALGSFEGLLVGTKDGLSAGCEDGRSDGRRLGIDEGSRDGFSDGCYNRKNLLLVMSSYLRYKICNRQHYIYLLHWME
jgi:hypothetical protein